MPSNPFKTSKAPKADPRVDKTADLLIREGPNAIEKGNRVQAWVDKYDAGRTKKTDALEKNVNTQGDAASAAGRSSTNMFDASYRPVMDLQVADAMGSQWLSPEAQKKQIDALYQNQTADKRITATERNALRRSYRASKAAVDTQTLAEKNAVGVATADAAQAENRNIEGLTMEAGRMGVDPSRILAARGANASDTAALAVDAAQRARFDVRDQRSKALATTANTGLQLKGQAGQETGQAAGIYSQNIGNINTTGHEVVQDKSASLPWHSLGLNTIQAGGQLALGKTQSNQNAVGINNSRNDGLFGAIGTGVGLALAT